MVQLRLCAQAIDKKMNKMIFLVDLSDHSMSETAEADTLKHCRERVKKSTEYSGNWPREVTLYSGASML